MPDITPQVAIYRDLLAEIKIRIRAAQNRAALSANAEMILLYWDIGRMIAARQEREGWGAGVIPRLAVDLKNELPEEKGFSETNLKRMVQFSQEYPQLFSIGARPVPQTRQEQPPAVSADLNAFALLSSPNTRSKTSTSPSAWPTTNSPAPSRPNSPPASPASKQSRRNYPKTSKRKATNEAKDRQPFTAT